MKTLFYLDMVNFERFFFFSQYLFGYLRKTFYLCSIAQLVQQWAVGGLIYEKDVFERLSLWSTNFANSNPAADR